jgi:hypothetical protein
LFVSASSAVAVELKLGAKSSPNQLLKYVPILGWEEEASGSRQQLGLLFIVPTAAIGKHWSACQFEGPTVDRSFVARFASGALHKKLSGTVRDLLQGKPEKLASVLDRVKLAVASWEDLVGCRHKIQAKLQQSHPGDQAFDLLIRGLTAQVKGHLAAFGTPMETWGPGGCRILGGVSASKFGSVAKLVLRSGLLW